MSRKFLWLVVVPLCILGAFTPRASGSLEAVLPAFVIEDSNGDALGPVVGFNSLNEPILRILDTAVDVPFLLYVKDDNHIVGPNSQTFFSGTNCTGTPYHNPALVFASEGLARMSGFAYSVARIGPAGPQWLIRSDSSSGGGSVTYNSVFFSPSDTCSNESEMATLRAATAFLNFDNEHPPLYSLR